MERTTNKGSYLRPPTIATLSHHGWVDGRMVAQLLLSTLFSRRISDPFAIVNPNHSSARAWLFHSSCQLRKLEANVEPVKLRGSSAAQGEGYTRERVLLVCGMRDCDSTPRTFPVPLPRFRSRPRFHFRPHLTEKSGGSSLPELLAACVYSYMLACPFCRFLIINAQFSNRTASTNARQFWKIESH